MVHSVRCAHRSARGSRCLRSSSSRPARRPLGVLACALLLAPGLLGPVPLSAQTSADSLAVLEAGVADWMENVRSFHPSGPPEVVCVSSRLGGDRDETPSLTPEQRAHVGAVFAELASEPLEVGDGCGIRGELDLERSERPFMADSSGRPAIRFIISPPTFETPDRAVLFEVGYVSGPLSGGGFRNCTWIRSEDADAGWRPEGCRGQYDI